MAQRTELVRTLFGSDPFDSGAIARGIGFVPEDRHRDGLMLDMTVTENLAMGMLNRFSRGPLLNRKEMTDAGQQAIGNLSIRTPDDARAVKLHSGGNQQKVLVGKWLNRKRSVRS